MRKIAVALLIAIPAVAHAENVYVFGADLATGEVRCTGTTVHLSREAYVLYAKTQCPLPLADKKNLRRYELKSPDHHIVGCWGALLGERVIFIDPLGNQSIQPSSMFAEAKIVGNGVAEIIRPVAETAALPGQKKCR
ncbi:hypothetical protein [Pandoraea sp. CB10b_02]|uniref:hypothetical protein n=1 Tax=Pandoraea sp. CB10b_02 TaxID=2014535 RepID=UPI00257C44E1|nr:hypothetical protein [Pandoraea sp. CB10b_02]